MNKQENSPVKSPFNPPLLRLLSLVSMIYFLYYLWWRVTGTLNPAAPYFSWALVLAEAFGVISYILFAWMTLDISPPREFKRPARGLAVDIFIPTYNEDPEILEATLMGCRNIRYPHKTYLLDDGNRSQLRELAERMGVRYIARPTHEHAKAGNINYALSNTEGEFIVILDADMVPQPEYLDRTLGYFEDERLALIQLPQEFYNQDSIQHASDSPSWHEQALFFRVIQPGKNYSNSAFWCGSPSVVRRAALEQVGGVATETITEDIHTTVRLHARGWKTQFLNEPLAFGIAPQTIEAFLLQRLRWAQGTMQLYRSTESPLWIPGLNLSQRLSYLASFLAYFESFQKLILLLTPVFILVFGLFPMRVTVGAFLLRWVPYFALNFLANQMGGRGVFHYFRTEKFNILKMLVFIQSTLILLYKKPIEFKVTPKSVDSSVYSKERKALRLYMVIAGVLTGAMLYGMLNVFSLHKWQISVDIFFIAYFWATYNQILILLALSEIFQKQHERRNYRFPVNLSGSFSADGNGHFEVGARVLDVSLSGARFIVDQEFLEPVKSYSLYLPTPDGKPIILPVDRIQYQSPLDTGGVQTGVSFHADLGDSRGRWIEYLYVTLPSQQAQTYYHVNKWDPPQQMQVFFQRVLGQFRTV